jgi:hypothetical protein|tara:strand:+ start:204 stop:713 length:510 start_codon:yes stop_codon:yes gene_type:complete
MNIKLYDFNNKWLNDLVCELYKFNRRTRMNYFSDISMYKSLSSKIAYLTQELQEMIDSCDYNFITIDETIPNNHKVYGFSCYYIKNKKCYNKLIFKSIDYPISKSMFYGNLEMFDRIKNLGFKKLYSVIDRPDEDRYIKFLKRFYNVEINKRQNEKTELIFNLENLLTN